MSNYTTERVSQLTANAPITLEKAKAFAIEFGLPQSSIVAKCVQMKIYKTAPKMVVAKVSRADLVEDIEERLRLPHGELTGLKNASGAALKTLLSSILVLEETS